MNKIDKSGAKNMRKIVGVAVAAFFIACSITGGSAQTREKIIIDADLATISTMHLPSAWRCPAPNSRFWDFPPLSAIRLLA
jgi:hypothetical protein